MFESKRPNEPNFHFNSFQFRPKIRNILMHRNFAAASKILLIIIFGVRVKVFVFYWFFEKQASATAAAAAVDGWNLLKRLLSTNRAIYCFGITQNWSNLWLTKKSIPGRKIEDGFKIPDLENSEFYFPLGNWNSILVMIFSQSLQNEIRAPVFLVVLACHLQALDGFDKLLSICFALSLH